MSGQTSNTPPVLSPTRKVIRNIQVVVPKINPDVMVHPIRPRSGTFSISNDEPIQTLVQDGSGDEMEARAEDSEILSNDALEVADTIEKEVISASTCTTPRCEIPEPRSKSPMETSIELFDDPEKDESSSLRSSVSPSTSVLTLNDSTDQHPEEASDQVDMTKDSLSRTGVESSCTISVAASITPDSLIGESKKMEQVKGYGDILEVLEKFELGQEPDVCQGSVPAPDHDSGRTSLKSNDKIRYLKSIQE